MYVYGKDSAADGEKQQNRVARLRLLNTYRSQRQKGTFPVSSNGPIGKSLAKSNTRSSNHGANMSWNNPVLRSQRYRIEAAERERNKKAAGSDVGLFGPVGLGVS